MLNFQRLPDYYVRVFIDDWPIKASAAWAGALVSVLFPSSAGQASALIVLGLVALDTVTGMVASRARGEAISSSKLGQAVSKIFSYFAAILAVAMAFHALPGMQSIYESAVSSVTSLMVLTELISVFENLVPKRATNVADEFPEAHGLGVVEQPFFISIFRTTDLPRVHTIVSVRESNNPRGRPLPGRSFFFFCMHFAGFLSAHSRSSCWNSKRIFKEISIYVFRTNIPL